MSEWKKVKLGEVSHYVNEKTSIASTNELYYVSTDSMLKDRGGIIAPESIPVNGNVTKYQKDDILVSNIRPYFKKIWFSNRNGGCSNDVLVFRARREINSQYLYYVLSDDSFFEHMMAGANGTKMPRGNKRLILNYSFGLPCLEVQCRIAEILSRYDTLIENYQKQIKLLEEAAQRLYKEWFVELRFPGHENTKMVDGLPEGWERRAVSQLGEYLNGFAFKPSDWQELGRPIIKIKEMGNGVGNDTPRNNGERVPAKYLVKAGDLLFSWSATLMVIVWSGEEGWLNQHLFKVTPFEGIGREFLLQSLSNAIEEFQNLTTGSTMKHIQRNKLDQVFVNVPNDEIMELYNNVAEKVREEILHLSSQIRLLTEARDRLLPKVMGGEIINDNLNQ